MIAQLSQVDPGRGEGGDRHAVTEEEDHVLGDALQRSHLHPGEERVLRLRPPVVHICGRGQGSIESIVDKSVPRIRNGEHIRVCQSDFKPSVNIQPKQTHSYFMGNINDSWCRTKLTMYLIYLDVSSHVTMRSQHGRSSFYSAPMETN